MAVSPAKLLDYLASTITKLPNKEFHNLLLGQGYIFETFFKGLKPRDMTGTDVTFSAMIKGDGDFGDAEVTGFGAYGAYSELPVIAREYMTNGRVPWSAYVGHWTASEHEIALNAGREGFQDLAKIKVEGMMTRMANGMEAEFWDPLAYLAIGTDKPRILGLNYWITDDGYHVGDPGGVLSVATPGAWNVGGINATDAAYNDDAGVNRWRNQFQQIATPNQLPDALDDMFTDCKFEAPPSVTVNTRPEYGKFRVVMSKTSFKAYRRIMKRLKETVDEVNPSINNVKLEMAGKMPARSDGTYETFFINLGTFRSYVHRDHNWTRGEIIKPHTQESRFQRIFLWPALACTDRRANGKVFGYTADLVEQ